MKEKWKAILKWCVGLAISTCALIGLVHTNFLKNSNPPSHVTHQEAMKKPLDALLSVEASYTPSLEVQENTDFLLTPAILIQQSIEAKQIIVYPNF